MKRELLLISMVILAIGCRQETETTTIAGETASTMAPVETAGTPQTPPQQTGTSPSPSATTTGTMPVPEELTHVRLTEYRIEMPDSLPAGRTTFHVMNEGKEKHSLEIEGGGIEKELGRELDPGATATLEVDLQPGTYRVYCPVDDHATKHGMTRELTVR